MAKSKPRFPIIVHCGDDKKTFPHTREGLLQARHTMEQCRAEGKTATMGSLAEATKQLESELDIRAGHSNGCGMMFHA